MAVVHEKNVEYFRSLLPPDVQYVKHHCTVADWFHDHYYYFVRGGKYITVHYAPTFEEWGAWETPAQEVSEANLDLSLAAVNDAETDVFAESSSAHGESARGLLVAVWDIVSKSDETPPKMYYNPTEVLFQVIKLATDAGVVLPVNLQQTLDTMRL